jgi:rfaE bifunctional protein nucleotidyltransferase chain/domain
MSRPTVSSAERILEVSRLLERLGPRREAGETVCFTNGCYDILHAGHLHLLEAAAGTADLLVVGLNTDESVRRLKGPERPWLPFADRAGLLASLEVVDFVVGFPEDTPANLIEAVQPDVLVKGGDWALDEIVGRDVVESRGGRVVTVPLAPGRSTTDLVERIRRA